MRTGTSIGEALCPQGMAVYLASSDGTCRDWPLTRQGTHSSAQVEMPVCPVCGRSPMPCSRAALTSLGPQSWVSRPLRCPRPSQVLKHRPWAPSFTPPGQWVRTPLGTAGAHLQPGTWW